ncbi:MAG: hypothetical protein HY566_02355, partial [Candidatus Kerfeldbacteria bacterium]|nr:hypothetical protein [Candidatus Kerfeldbacteria bacterium]
RSRNGQPAIAAPEIDDQFARFDPGQPEHPVDVTATSGKPRRSTKRRGTGRDEYEERDQEYEDPKEQRDHPTRG